jgi:hypothetical protein
MIFLIITHVPHILSQNQYFAYGPYVREMNIWIKQATKVIIVAPQSAVGKTDLDIYYEHQNIEFVTIDSVDLLSLPAILRTVLKTPKISSSVFDAMSRADHIHLRCPGNIGLIGSCIQILFPKKPKTAKYAGNWDPKAKQPWSYKLQEWILSNIFLSRNMQVLVCGREALQISSLFLRQVIGNQTNGPLLVESLTPKFIFFLWVPWLKVKTLYTQYN